MCLQSIDDRVLLGIGVIATLVGAYLPWAQPNPELPPDAKIPTYEFSGMYAGFGVFDVVFFVLMGAVIISIYFLEQRRQAIVTLLAGVVLLLTSTFYISGSTIGFNATFTPTLGWYLTILGGILWSLSGGRILFS